MTNMAREGISMENANMSPVEHVEELYRRIGAQQTAMVQDDPAAKRDQSIATMRSATNALFDYSNSIDKLSHESRMASAIYPGDSQMQIEHIRTYDMARTRCHGRAMRALNDMNRVSAEYGMDPIFEGDPMSSQSRPAVTGFTLAYVREAKEAGIDNERLYEMAREADDRMEDTRQKADFELLKKSNEAIGTLTKGQEAAYWPEYAAKKASENPNWVVDEARKTAQRWAEGRAQDRLPPVWEPRRNGGQEKGEPQP